MRGVIGLSNQGQVMAQMPDGISDLSVARNRWAGRVVLGMTGVVEQVSRVLNALGLAHVPTGLDRAEPLYDLDLACLAGPFEKLRATRPDELQRLEVWFQEYLRDIGFAMDDQSARVQAAERAKRAVNGTAVRLLDDVHRTPVAMTTFIAEAGDTVKIGGVFVPRTARKKGYARHVVASHLAEARARGIKRAILSSASDAAGRAYEAIGFQRIGTYRIVLFKSPATIKGAT